MPDEVHLARIYDDAPAGRRVLVDRLWPRGVSKARAALDAWAKDLAPSDELRRNLHDGNLDFEAFAAAYSDELAEQRDAVLALFDTTPLTLLTAAKDPGHSHLSVLRAFWEAQPA